MARDLGDFQTPPALVAAVLDRLAREGFPWARALEPTCGQGAFIRGLLTAPNPPHEIHAIELQSAYVAESREIAKAFPETLVTVRQANVFDLRLQKDIEWKEAGPLLVIGNPPWVTNATLGALESANAPKKANLRASRGLDALTGESNFDISEAIWLKLIRELAPLQPTIALLCKTSTARRVLMVASELGLPITNGALWRIDARKWFGAAVDACLFRLDVRRNAKRYEAVIYPDLNASESQSTITVFAGHVVPHAAMQTRVSLLDRPYSLTWRQGIKHDAATVAELTLDEHGNLRNKLSQIVSVEEEYLYPLLKGSDVYHGRIQTAARMVIVPQKRLREETLALRWTAPRLWTHLSSHRELFARRKSSIYRNQPDFSFFGLGNYSFVRYKVGISGFHKSPRFRAIGPIDDRPVMLDDTCYFISCSSPQQAALLTALLNDPLSLETIAGMIFLDAKRPITKRVLQRLDLKAFLDAVDTKALLERAHVELVALQAPIDGVDEKWRESLDVFLGTGPSDSPLAVQLPLFVGVAAERD